MIFYGEVVSFRSFELINVADKKRAITANVIALFYNVML